MFIKNRVTYILYDSFVMLNRVTHDSFVMELVCLLKTELHMTVL